MTNVDLTTPEHSYERAELPNGEEASAVLSRDGTYRYQLARTWDPERPKAMWIMLNPSTATHRVDDATIRRVRGFTKTRLVDTDGGDAGGFVVVNLFALRATFPNALDRHDDPIGPSNDFTIRYVAQRSDVRWIVAAYGAYPYARPRARFVVEDLLADFVIGCMGRTKDGSPRHPLYLPKLSRLEEFRG